ncbi:D-alanine--D-alanine ligase [Caldanaerobius fijiensis DSM 17918]|uniref:D-alanine--D-alanine ligase n=1 Tax=Caldanaerobius fijiensis DSM 17918 TaxID=1121256 RepID=A0A1M5AFM7_9THEO|nr:D-alanine--D-alanine ligase family protein [Caldanaerobius fijiensis]SHF29098.1 D-alanine--D-alanine ligase [Caldanaerobius fijiensis DSM 17918]
MEKLNVAVLFGGKSGEHEVSIMSAMSVMKNLSKEKYNIIPVGIDKDGQWYLYKGDTENIRPGEWIKNSKKAFIPPDPFIKGVMVLEDDSYITLNIDVVFPVLHGPNGEDGTVQGLLELAELPYVGSGVVGSACAMDKAVANSLFLQAGLPHADFVALRSSEAAKFIDEIEKRFGYPCFVKPANMGSSVGITKAHNREELVFGLKEAGKYDKKIVVEKFINAREIECAVLGDDDVVVSYPGEIIPSKEFYDYEAKYLDGDNSKLLIPADLPEEKTREIRELAARAYKAVNAEGMARVDFLVDRDTLKVYINEVNTIPGFTRISMYPKLMEYSGIPYGQLLDRLIDIAIKRRKKDE